MKMYSFASSPNCWKVLALAHELAIPLEMISIDLFNGESKSPGFLAKNPNGRVPVLDDEGFVLWESNAILAYLASRRPSPSLLPTEPRERAEVDRWLYWESGQLAPAVWKVEFEKVIKPLLDQAPDLAMIAAGKADFAVAAKVLDGALAGKAYVAGALSVADFALAPFVNVAAGPCELDIVPFKHLSAWRDRMNARESVKRSMADAA